jgi:formate hydrogenlyase subunit 6/NADH:ubiquinone oxidoreductase subunit I
MDIMDFAPLAIKNLFSKPATKNYPEEPAFYPKGSRGHVSINIDDCIMCGMCMRKCPSGAIKVDRAKKEWSIERMGCVQCENCVNACPKSCLTMTPGYTTPSTEKTVDTFAQPIEEKETGKVVNDISKCILCGLCARKCPQECITVDRTGEKTWSIDRDKCVQCGACVDACLKFKALSMTKDNGEKGIVTVKKEA